MRLMIFVIKYWPLVPVKENRFDRSGAQGGANGGVSPCPVDSLSVR